jgi:membrane protein implicated in regulation of membrane protease activity
MRRHWKLLILAGILLAAVAGAGKLAVFAALTLLLPVYGLLWMSMFLIGFIVLASIVVPVTRRIIENRESVETEAEVHEKPSQAA